MTDEDFDGPEAAARAEEEADCQRKAEPPPVLDLGEFTAWRSPRTVSDNPTHLDNSLWHWLVRTRWSAYRANEKFHGPSSIKAGPMWCFDRFGKSETTLADGRVVHIGGEHEDFYDPDFYIYNDVTVIGPDSAIAIYGYPREAFPPTDFHTATRVGNAIIMVGGLGYRQQRMAGSTPVFRLSLDAMTIARVETSGEAPGWIHRHTAMLSADGDAIVVQGGQVWYGDDRSMQDNIDTWSLDVASGHWTRLSALDWQRWAMRRVDRKPNRLWDIRQALWHRDHPWAGVDNTWRHDDAPDFDALAMLYRLDETTPPPEKGSNDNDFYVVVDGVRIRFTEGFHSVQAIVEGRLSQARLDVLRRKTLATLEQLHASAWEIEMPLGNN